MIYTTKDLVPSKNYKSFFCIAFGLFGFAMIFTKMLSVAWFLFWGFSIFLAYLGEKLRAYIQSYITLYNDKIEGMAVSGSKNIIIIHYSDIQSLRISEDQNRVVIRDKYGEFTFQANGCAREVFDRINQQMNI